jgi:hypothetical protein
MEQLQNLSLNESNYNPGTVLTEKNNDTEYILLGYDHTRNNLICVSKNEHVLNNNVYVINKNNIDKIIKNHDVFIKTKFLFE